MLFLAVCIFPAVAIILIGCSALNPLRRSEPDLRAWILSQAPLGASPAAVVKLITDKGWTKSYDTSGPQTELSEKFYPGVKGMRIIGAELGYYYGLPWGRVDVEAFWGFDADGKLIDLHVRKGVSSL
jgi:hypothetical protein